MPLADLLQAISSCMYQGTSIKEGKARVRVVPESSESVRFYIIDDQSPHVNPECNFRANARIRGALCDLLIHYISNGRVILCLVEMKGRNVKDAGRQILNTYQQIRRRFNGTLTTEVEWKAHVALSTSAPADNAKPTRKDLENIFGKDNATIHRRPDIGWFLRS